MPELPRPALIYPPRSCHACSLLAVNRGKTSTGTPRPSLCRDQVGIAVRTDHFLVERAPLPRGHRKERQRTSQTRRWGQPTAGGLTYRHHASNAPQDRQSRRSATTMSAGGKANRGNNRRPNGAVAILRDRTCVHSRFAAPPVAASYPSAKHASEFALHSGPSEPVRLLRRSGTHRWSDVGTPVCPRGGETPPGR